MIQEYLNAQFIKTTEDSNFEKLKKTCGEVAKKIAKDKPKILAYSLVAFDPNISTDNKEVEEIKKHLIENWQTFLTNSKDTSLTIIRAVMLEALETVAKDSGAADVVWFGARNCFQHFKLDREATILTSFLKALGNEVESKAAESWQFDSGVEIPKVSAGVIDEGEFAAGITAVTVKDAINKANKKQVSELKDSQKRFADLINQMQMRSQLIWWKEAGYSPLLRKSYKGIKDGVIQVLLAHDYSSFIPDQYPVSVDYFLIGTHRGLSGNAQKKIKLSDFLKLLEESSSELTAVIPPFSGENIRISLADFVSGFISEKFKANQFKSLTGIELKTELTLDEITLWLFHDLHAARLTRTK